MDVTVDEQLCVEASRVSPCLPPAAKPFGAGTAMLKLTEQHDSLATKPSSQPSFQAEPSASAERCCMRKPSAGPMQSCSRMWPVALLPLIRRTSRCVPSSFGTHFRYCTFVMDRYVVSRNVTDKERIRRVLRRRGQHHSYERVAAHLCQSDPHTPTRAKFFF